MLRVKDPHRSIKFYELLGMKQIKKIENPESRFDLYFLAFDSTKSVSHGQHWTDRQGILELTHSQSFVNCYVPFGIIHILQDTC